MLDWNENPDNALTEWESKAIADGRKILHAEFIKPTNFLNAPLQPIFDKRQISFRSFIDGKLKYYKSTEDIEPSEFNALKIPENLLL